MTVDGSLASVPLLACLGEEDLRRLEEHCELVELTAGTQLFAEGDHGDRAYVISSGEIDILKQTGDREVLLAVRKQDEVIGEMALLQAAPRSATARARTDAQLVAIPKAQLDWVMETSPEAVRGLFRVLLERWKATQAQLQQSERMAQLGTLTAGLAHELNNPAAAVSRAVEQLRSALADSTVQERRLVADLDAEARATLASLRETLRFAPPELSAIDRADLEQDVEDRLERVGIEDAWRLAPAIVEAGLADQIDTILSAGGDRTEELLGALRAEQGVGSLLYEIEEGTRRLSAIVRALKSYSYLDQAPVQNVDVTAGLEDTLLILKSKLAGIAIERHYEPNLPRIEAYGGELNQVWTNLLDNAADAINEAGGEGVITLRASHEGDLLVVEVEDNGPGIDAAHINRVFDSFFTTKPPGSGTGLGLNISYGIVVHKHRGNLTVTSEPGATTFRVELPTTTTSGGPAMPACQHLTNVPLDPMPAGGCEDCLAINGTWVHLRYCVECGRTSCCDDSPNRHARAHAAATGHPVIRSKEPGEDWAWCYIDETGVRLESR